MTNVEISWSRCIKKTLDVSIPQENGTYLHKKISNDAVGFKSIISIYR